MSDSKTPETLNTTNFAAPPFVPPIPATADTLDGLDLRGYELIQPPLGVGGMGEVYRAVDPALGRELAVKVMKADYRGSAEAERRFIREARVTGSLQHPGIVSVHNLGRLADGRLHYTMRLVRGRTLADVLNDEAGKAEHWPDLLTIFVKTCQAVAYAHSKQVIHRDLKPSNIMVGRYGEVQVMDWGLAKLLGERDCVSAPCADAPCAEEATRIQTEAAEKPSDMTRMGVAIGTPAYMPPEQALGEWDIVDERGDVFALGAILCEMLTAQPPYLGRDSEEIFRRAKRGEIAEALARLERCGAEAALVQLCRACLSPVREARPRDADAVAKSVAAHQAEVQERLRRAELERTRALVKSEEEQKRRRRTRVFLVLLSIAAAVGIWLAVRATNAAKAERQAKELAETRLGYIENTDAVLTAIFRDLNPSAEEKGGPTLRQQLSQHLERAAAKLDETAIGDPTALARLQIALGNSLGTLDQTTSAIDLLRKAATTLETQLGADHPDTLAARHNLAQLSIRAGRPAEAIGVLEQLLPQLQSKLGDDHPSTLEARDNLAQAYLQVRRTADGVRLLEENLKQRQTKLGADHPNTLNARNNLAGAYWYADRAADAIRLLEPLLRQRENKLGVDHPETLTTRHNLAEAYRVTHRLTEAIHLHEQNVPLRQAKLGPDHPETLSSLAALGLAYQAAHRLPEALAQYEKALARGRRRREGFPPALTRLPGTLARLYEQTGQFPKAEAVYRDMLKQAEKQFGADDPRTAGGLAQLGVNLSKQKKFADAEPLLRHSVTIRDAKQPDDWTTFYTRTALGEALAGQKKFAEAEPLLVQGCEEMMRRRDKIPESIRRVRLQEAIERLIRMYEAMGQKDKAENWRKQLPKPPAAKP